MPAVGIDQIEIAGCFLMHEDGTALITVAALGLKRDHRIGHVVEYLRRAENRDMSAEDPAIKAPNRVLVFRMPGEFPERLLDEVDVAEILGADIEPTRTIA